MIEFDGTPILLNAEIPREDDVLQLLEKYRPQVEELEGNIVGYTKVHLEGRSEICRSQECNLANLVTDSMIHARVLEDLGGAYWTDAAIAFVQGGGKLFVCLIMTKLKLEFVHQYDSFQRGISKSRDL